MRIFPTRSALRFGLRSLLFAPVFFVGETCTKLTEVPHDALTTSTAFHTDAEVLAGVAGVYAQLRAIEWVGYIILQDLTTDVAIVPTRGSDWYDNGQWLDLHRQTWTPNSSGELAFVDGAWNDLFSGVAKANLIFSSIRRHTSFDCDWSSDVCSSDLLALRRHHRVELGAFRFGRTTGGRALTEGLSGPRRAYRCEYVPWTNDRGSRIGDHAGKGLG